MEERLIFIANLLIRLSRLLPAVKLLNYPPRDTNLQKLLLDDYSVKNEQVVLGSLILSGAISFLCIISLLIIQPPLIYYVLPGILFFGLSLYLIRYFPKYYRAKSDEIEIIFPLLRNCIELYLSFLPQKSDISTFLINFLTNIPSPVQKTFREKQKMIQEGEVPEHLLLKYTSPSPILENYLKKILISNFQPHLTPNNADIPLETRYKIHSRSLESRISITFFFGFFIPLSFSLGVYLQGIRGIFLLSSSPILFIVLFLLSKQISKDNSILLGTITGHNEIQAEYLEYWDFFSNIASNLISMSPDMSLIQAIESTNLTSDRHLVACIRKFKSYNLTLTELLENIHNQIKGVRTKLLFGTLKFMITTNSLVASERIYDLLTILKKHQNLEIQRMVTLKSEIYKVRAFQIILPVSIGLITSIFLILSTNLIQTFFSFAVSSTDLMLFGINQLLSVVISVFFFRKIVGLKKSVWAIIVTILTFLLVSGLGFLIFAKISFTISI